MKPFNRSFLYTFQIMCLWESEPPRNGNRGQSLELAFSHLYTYNWRGLAVISACFADSVRVLQSNNLPALEMESCRTVVTAQQVSPFPATIAGVVVSRPAAPPDVPHQFPTPFLYLVWLRGRQQCLNLLQKLFSCLVWHRGCPLLV